MRHKVILKPLGPTEADRPLGEMFSLTPGTIVIRRLKRNPIAQYPLSKRADLSKDDKATCPKKAKVYSPLRPAKLEAITDHFSCAESFQRGCDHCNHSAAQAGRMKKKITVNMITSIAEKKCTGLIPSPGPRCKPLNDTSAKYLLGTGPSLSAYNWAIRLCSSLPILDHVVPGLDRVSLRMVGCFYQARLHGACGTFADIYGTRRTLA